MNEARTRAADGYLARALEAATGAAERCRSPATLQLRAEILAELGLDGEAIAAWGKVAEAGGDRGAAEAAIAALRRRPPAMLPAGQGDRARALALYRDGVDLRLAGKADAAVRQLRLSYAAWPHPLTIVQIALAHRAAGRVVDARKAAERALALAEATRGQRAVPRLRSGHTRPVLAVAFSADGRLMVSGGADHAVLLWDAATGRELRRFEGHTDAVKAVALSPDGRRLASAGLDKVIRIWDLTTAALERELAGHEEPVESLAFAPGGRRLASAGWDKTVRLWDVDAGTALATLAHREMAMAVAFAPDGTRLATGGMGDGVRLWSADGAPLGELATGEAVSDVAFAAGGNRLAIGTSTDVQMWEVSAASRRLWAEPLRDGAGGDGVAVEAVAFSPDGARLAVAGGLVVSVRDAAGGATRRDLHGHQGQVFAVAFRDAEVIASGSMDDTIRMWNADRGEELRVLRFHGDYTERGAFHPAGRLALLRKGEVALRGLGQGGAVERFAIDPDGGELSLNSAPLAFSVDGRQLACSSASGDVTIRRDGRSRLLGHATGTPAALAFSPDGRRLAAAGQRGVTLWTTADGAQRELVADVAATAVIWTSDAAQLAVAVQDGGVRLIDAGTGRQVRSLALPPTAKLVNALAAHGAAGQRVIAVAADRVIAVYGADGQPRALVDKAHAGLVSHLVFGPDGTLASGGMDGKVKLWRPGATEPHRVLETGERLIDLGWRDDTLWAVDWNGQVALWDAATGAPRGQLVPTGGDGWLAIAADGRLDGNLDEEEREQLLYWQVGDVQLPAFVGWERQREPGLIDRLVGKKRTPDGRATVGR